jgi:quercetin dioxygenase-like cupin family protein
MSVNSQTNTPLSRAAHQPLSTPNGTLFELLASPQEGGEPICLIRVTVPPGVVVPLHSHPDLEIFYILEGSMEIFQAKKGANGWKAVGVGDAVAVPGNVKHALRNTSSLPATIVLVTTSKMCQFFGEVSKPFDPNRCPLPRLLKKPESSLAPLQNTDIGWPHRRRMRQSD